MLRLCTHRFHPRAMLVFVANRNLKRYQHDDAVKTQSDTPLEEVPVNNISFVKNVKAEDLLLDLSPPKPFEEVPVNEEKGDFHPAEFIDSIGPPLPISFNLAAYVNESETLMKLVQLGVDLSEMDKDPKKAKYVLTLDFEKHIKKHIQFLHDQGVESDALGKFITKNPFIFKEDLENLQIRVNYLKSKKFTPEAISRIITNNPYFLSRSTKTVDRFLGFLQKQFHLTGDEVRFVFTRCPKLVTYDQQKFQEKIFINKEVFGFTGQEMKKLLTAKPKIFMLGARVLKERFNIVHNVMKISHERILDHPNVFLRRTFMLKERHEYLVYLNRAQYDPTKPNYVSLDDMAMTTDSEFCKLCAKTSVDQYNDFLKTK